MEEDPRPQHLNNLLFADTETTGTEDEDRLCQLCFYLNNLEVNQLYKPPLPIKIGAMAVHHITNKMVDDKREFAGSAEHMILNGLRSTATFVAHNAKFDIRMLEKEGLFFDHVICTLKLSRFLDEQALMESHSLQYLRYYYDLDIEAAAHDALGDVLVLRAVFDKLMALLAASEDLSPEAALARALEICSKPSLIRRFNFGKYKGELVEDIAKRDRGYLRWLQGEKRKEPKDEEDWLYTLSLYL